MSVPDVALEAIAAEERILDWEGALNARDTGGLPTAGGGRIRRGALVRSDVLSRLTPTGREALVRHGVRTIIDVRSAAEIEIDRDRYPSWEGQVTYLNVPFTTGRELAWEELRERYDSATTRAHLNRIDVDVHPEGIGAIVRSVADAPAGGVLIHCHAGKDRTGVLVALLLAVAGVADEHIADDYALTMLNIEPLIAEWLEEMGGGDAERERLRRLAYPTRDAMLDTLAYVRTTHGSIEAFLRSAGVTEEQLERIRRRLVEVGDADRA